MGEYADEAVDYAMNGWWDERQYDWMIDDEDYVPFRRRYRFNNKRRKQPEMIIEGTIYWCKLDKPRDNYNKQKKIMKKAEDGGGPDRWGREYAVTLGNLTKETKLQLRDAGLLDKVKDKMDDLGDQITFRLDEFDKDGDPQEFKVFDENGDEWDWKENGLIGNLSKGAVKFNVWKKPGIKARIYPLSMIVLEHVEYEAPEGSGEYEDADDWSAYANKGKPAPEVKAKEPAKKARTKATVAEDLDDDIPF